MAIMRYLRAKYELEGKTLQHCKFSILTNRRNFPNAERTRCVWSRFDEIGLSSSLEGARRDSILCVCNQVRMSDTRGARQSDEGVFLTFHLK